MVMVRLLAIATAATLAFLPRIPTAGAQRDSIPGSVNISRLGRLCWAQVRPAPHCQAWVATEFSWEHPVAFTKLTDPGFRRDDFKPRFATSIGPMFNFRPDAAVGAIFAFNPNEYGLDLLRAEGRYRRWVGARTGIDIGLGYAHARVPAGPGLDDILARGMTAGISVEHRWDRPRRATRLGERRRKIAPRDAGGSAHGLLRHRSRVGNRYHPRSHCTHRDALRRSGRLGVCDSVPSSVAHGFAALALGAAIIPRSRSSRRSPGSGSRRRGSRSAGSGWRSSSSGSRAGCSFAIATVWRRPAHGWIFAARDTLPESTHLHRFRRHPSRRRSPRR